MHEYEVLAADIGDPELVGYFYLNRGAAAVLDKLDSLKVELTPSQEDVPFNAQVKGYLGAIDDDSHMWIIKPAVDPKEILYHRICALAYLLDHETGTLAAPTTVFRIGKKTWRASKVVKSAMQISSYNYMERPYLDIFRADLVNRWLYFDEDRNPNNYLVIHNTANKPFVCAIDYDKADLLAETMKITGNTEKFGWHRTEKTRFLTLLRPENFDGVSIDVFEKRLSAFTTVPDALIAELARRLVEGYTEDPIGVANKVAANVIRRRAYIDEYFRRMFKSASETKDVGNDDEYSMLGKSFLAMYNDKK